MDFLYLLEKIRMPLLNDFMLLVTRLGEETFFLVVAMVVFWCVDKYKGYFLLSVGFIGTIINQFLKLIFRIPRPWVLDENFTILEEAREAATGYSFPSGHTQSAVGTFGSVAATEKKNWIRIPCIVIAALVAFSRMYIGVHTPKDVIVSVIVALALIFLLRPVVLRNGGKYIPYLLGFMLALAIGFFAFVELFPFPADVDPHNLASGVKNAYTLLGALLGLLCVYIVDEKWLKFDTKAVWWAQVLKVAFGLLLVLVVKSGLKTPLNAVFGESVGRAARYYLMVVVAGILWPLSFRLFAKMGKKGSK